MPPKRSNTSPVSGRPNKRPNPETPTKRRKPQPVDVPKRNWFKFLPRGLAEKLQVSTIADEWKKHFLVLTAIVTLKVRVFIDDIPNIIDATLPPALAHLSEGLRIWADRQNKELLQYISVTHMRFANSLVHAIGDEADKIRAAATKNRASKVKIPRAFPDTVSVKKHIKLDLKDILELWAPLVGVIDNQYIDEDVTDTRWLLELESSSYRLIGLFASGLLALPSTRTGYTEKAQRIDLFATSNDMIEGWPMAKCYDSWKEMPDRWARFSDVWPRSSQQVSDEEEEFTDDSSMPSEPEETMDESIMQIAEEADADDEDDAKEALDGVTDAPGKFFTYQFSPEYITEEASRIAQLNTAGLLAYTIARLDRREDFYKTKVVWAHDRAEEAQQARRYLIERREAAQRQEERFRMIMEEGTATKKEIRKEKELQKQGSASIRRRSSEETRDRKKGMLGMLGSRHKHHDSGRLNLQEGSSPHPTRVTSQRRNLTPVAEQTAVSQKSGSLFTNQGRGFGTTLFKSNRQKDSSDLGVFGVRESDLIVHGSHPMPDLATESNLCDCGERECEYCHPLSTIPDAPMARDIIGSTGACNDKEPSEDDEEEIHSDDEVESNPVAHLDAYQVEEQSGEVMGELMKDEQK